MLTRKKQLKTAFLSAIAFLTLSATTLGAPKKWNEVTSWVYQLCNYKDGKLAEIAEAKFDLAVIDLSRDGENDFFTQREVALVRESGKIVLAYFEIGAIEEYRPEWNRVPDDLKAGRVAGWPKEHIKSAGKLILGVDYAKKSKSIADAYKKQREIGLVPYVSVEQLDVVLPENK